MFTWVIGPKGSFAMPRGFLLRILQEENPGQKLAPDRSETPWEWPIFRFEASQLADLRADFGIFTDTKYRELPGAW
jgi:hypothetical protein